MAKLHIIGVGGTGHKVLLSAVHLAACGAFKGNLGPIAIDGINILTIDADNSNGNLSELRTTLESYKRFYSALGGGNLGLTEIESVSPDVNLPLYNEDKKSINTTFNIVQYDKSDIDKFIRFLYSDSEIDAEFEQGFYGHTSIGTLIVKDILKDSPLWHEQLSRINQGDFVVVIGSIFGGTGASAVPVLLEELEKKKGSFPSGNSFNLAAVILNPYFRTVGEIKESGELQPNADNFSIKAKAALYYYHEQKRYTKTNALYVIGEPSSNFSVESASRGANNQRNKVHPIELFAATAIIDFIKNKYDRQDGKILTAERDADANTYYWSWSMLQNVRPELPSSVQTMVKAAVFYNKVIFPHIAFGGDAGSYLSYYSDELKTRRDEHQNLVYENIFNYFRLLLNYFFDLHKKNKDIIDPNTGKLSFEVDKRIKLFDAQWEGLFKSGVRAEDAVIKNFDCIVYRDSNAKVSNKIYDALNKIQPTKEQGKDFDALLTILFEIIKKEEKGFLGLGGAKKVEQDNFGKRAYLSEENNATFVRPDAGTGKLWSKGEPIMLTNIANGLPTGVAKTFTKNDISIPSPWSIFIMNELTLPDLKDKTGKTDKFGDLNRNAYNEWCGLVALTALRKLCRYDKAGLHLEKLDLGERTEDDFVSVVDSTLKPDSHIFDNPKWTNCSRLSLNGITLAFLANNTLLCPAYSYDASTKEAMRRLAPSIFGENGEFLNPSKYFEDTSMSINRDAKYALYLFLKELNDVLTEEAKKNTSEIIGTLMRITGQFKTDLGKTTQNKELAISPDVKTKIHSVEDIFNLLVIAPSAKNIELPFMMSEASGPYSAALIGLNICGINSASAEAANYLVTENLMYNRINADTIPQYANQKHPDGIMLFYDQQLLLDTMVIIKKEGGDAVFHALQNSNINGASDYGIIWPVSEALLDYYSTEKLNKMLSMSMDTEKVTITLNIKLGNGTHTITKEYRIKNHSENDNELQNGMCFIMEKSLVPYWSCWPYSSEKQNNSWQSYNFFCAEPNYRGVPVLEIDPFFVNDGKTALAGDPRPLSRCNSVIHTVSYKRYKKLPVGFKFREKTDGAPIYRGAVLLAEPREIPASGAVEWTVGVDFGTTSTTAYYTAGGDPDFVQILSEYNWIADNKEPLVREFKNDKVVLCKSDYPFAEDYFIDKFCYGQKGWPTTLELMDTSYKSDSSTIFETTRIFWHNHENFRKVIPNAERRADILTNIKWEGGNKTNSGKFLNQLLTHISYTAAEKGVRKIQFYFSYPTAFGGRARDAFSNQLANLIKGLADNTGLNLIFDAGNNLITESVAAAYYFRFKNKNQPVFFCADIGGGSTDASVWVRKKHIFQTSIHFASRDMFIAPLRKLLERESVKDAVCTSVVEDGIHTMLKFDESGGKLSGDQFKFLIETVLFEYYDLFVSRLQGLQGDDEKAFYKFTYCVFVAYTGLIYYFANIISVLIAGSREDRKIDNDITEIVLGLSGKGSKLTEWIRSPCHIIYEEAQKYIEERTGMNLKIRPQFSLDTAKTETAFGMVCNLDSNGNQRNEIKLVSAETYMGSDITIKTKSGKTKQIQSDDLIDIYKDEDQLFNDPKELTVEIDTELVSFDRFIAFFNKVAAQTNGDMPLIPNEWYKGYKKTLLMHIKENMANTLEEEERFEPPFIIILKTFLEDYSEEYLWKN
ncbi:MAG: hypothetical protein LBT24_00590 [Tannerella sp.]|jgi:hypothetical protein|nr:hypothetical protein [Tannerella sp.]